MLCTIGIYANNATNSFVGIGPSAGVIGTQGAWSRLHLDNSGSLLKS